MLSQKNINSAKVAKETRPTRQVIQSNELTLLSDSLSMLAETTINNDHHVPCEESTINHHLENESPPSCL